MGFFRHKKTDEVTEAAPGSDQEPGEGEQRAAVHAGVPGRCPTCDGFGYIDNIDMVHRHQRQHCRECGHVWEFSFDEDGEVLDLTDIETGSLERAHQNRIIF